MKYLVFGKDGWLANKVKDYFGEEKAMVSAVDCLDLPAIRYELDKKKPKVVINSAGITGRPNIDWCEDHKLETIAGNVTVPLNILQACSERNIYWVHFGSGCIFQGDNNGKGWKENDEVQPPSFYSWTKFWADSILKHFPVLILRLRMPVDTENNPRNLINKLAKYKQVWNPQNSITVIQDLLDALKKLTDMRKIGIYHIANPGTIGPAEIMELYQKIVDPRHKFEKIETEELYTKGLAKAVRSNCVLNTDKLASEGIILKPIKERIVEVLEEYKRNLKNSA